MPASSFCAFCGKRQPGKDARPRRGHIAVSFELIARLDAMADADGRTRHELIDELVNKAIDESVDVSDLPAAKARRK